MSEPILIIVHLVLVDKAARDETVEKLFDIAELSKTELKARKFAICLPREDDGVTCYAVEEFENLAAFKVYREHPLVKAMGPSLRLAPTHPPGALVLQYLPDQHFTSASILSHGDPFIHYKELEQAPSPESEVEQKAGILSYGIARELANESRVFALEVFENESQALEGFIHPEKVENTRVKYHALRKVGGFLHQ